MPIAWHDIFSDPAEWTSVSSWPLAERTCRAIFNAIDRGEDLIALRPPPGWAHQGSALDELILAADMHNLESTMFVKCELSSVTRLIAYGVPLIESMAKWSQQWQEHPPSRNSLLAAIAAGCSPDIERFMTTFGYPNWQLTLGTLVESSDEKDPDHLALWLHTVRLVSKHAIPSGANACDLRFKDMMDEARVQPDSFRHSSVLHMYRAQSLDIWPRLLVLEATGLDITQLWDPDDMKWLVMKALLRDCSVDEQTYLRVHGATCRSVIHSLRGLLDKLELYWAGRDMERWDDLMAVWPRVISWYNSEIIYWRFLRTSLLDAPCCRQMPDTVMDLIEACLLGPSLHVDLNAMHSQFRNWSMDELIDNIRDQQTNDDRDALRNALCELGWRDETEP